MGPPTIDLHSPAVAIRPGLVRPGEQCGATPECGISCPRGVRRPEWEGLGREHSGAGMTLGLESDDRDTPSTLRPGLVARDLIIVSTRAAASTVDW